MTLSIVVFCVVTVSECVEHLLYDIDHCCILCCDSWRVCGAFIV